MREYMWSNARWVGGLRGIWLIAAPLNAAAMVKNVIEGDMWTALLGLLLLTVCIIGALPCRHIWRRVQDWCEPSGLDSPWLHHYRVWPVRECIRCHRREKFDHHTDQWTYHRDTSGPKGR